MKETVVFGYSNMKEDYDRIMHGMHKFIGGLASVGAIVCNKDDMDYITIMAKKFRDENRIFCHHKNLLYPKRMVTDDLKAGNVILCGELEGGNRIDWPDCNMKDYDDVKDK